MRNLDEAVAAYDAALAAGGAPAAACFAAAVVLDVPVADALNVLLAARKVDFMGYRRPNDKVNAVVVRLARV